MIIIVDTNILISALIKNAQTRKIMVTANEHFVLPEIALEEVRDHEATILKKSGLSKEEYNHLLTRLLNYVELIPIEKLKTHLQKACRIMEKIDIDDAAFIAAALAYTDAIIWSDDKHFKKQQQIKVFNTQEMMLLLQGA